MSQVSLDKAKRHLRITHGNSDVLIQECIDAAEDEAEKFTGVDIEILTSSSSDATAPSWELGVLLLVQAHYDGSPEQQETYRAAAEVKLMPFRCNLGI